MAQSGTADILVIQTLDSNQARGALAATPSCLKRHHARQFLRANIQDRNLTSAKPHSSLLPRIRLKMPFYPKTDVDRDGQDTRQGTRQTDLGISAFRSTQMGSSRIPPTRTDANPTPTTAPAQSRIMAKYRREQSLLDSGINTQKDASLHEGSGSVRVRQRQRRKDVEDEKRRVMEDERRRMLERGGGVEGRLGYAHMPVTLSQLHGIMKGTDKRFKNFIGDGNISSEDTKNTKTNIRIRIKRDNQSATPAVQLTMKVTLPNISQPPTTPSTSLLPKQRTKKGLFYNVRPPVLEESPSVTYPDDCDANSGDSTHVLRHLGIARLGSVEKTRRWLVDNPVERSDLELSMTPCELSLRTPTTILPPVVQQETSPKPRPVIKIRLKTNTEMKNEGLNLGSSDGAHLLSKRSSRNRITSQITRTPGPTSATLKSLKEADL